MSFLRGLFRRLFPPSMATVRAEHEAKSAGWRCPACGRPHCAWSRFCPEHAAPGEREAFLGTPKGQAWKRDTDEIMRRHGRLR